MDETNNTEQQQVNAAADSDATNSSEQQTTKVKDSATSNVPAEGGDKVVTTQENKQPESNEGQPSGDKCQDDVKKEAEIKPEDIKDAQKASEFLKTKNIDFAELQQEYNTKGEISQETREKLKAAGISDEMTDNFIEGQKARVEAFYDDISTAVGGREEMNTVIDWARQNISAEEAQSIDAVTDPRIIKIILKDLKARMEDKEGHVPEQIVGSGGAAPRDVYESMAEMKADISNPKYHKDEAFRNKVLVKIQASKAAGTIRL